MNGTTSAFGGFQLSKKSFCPSDTGLDYLLRIRQDITEKSVSVWQDNDGLDEELRLDRVIIQYLESV